MSFSAHQASEIKDLQSQIANLQRLRGDSAIVRDDLRNKVLRLEFDLAEITKDRDHWKKAHNNLFQTQK